MAPVGEKAGYDGAQGPKAAVWPAVHKAHAWLQCAPCWPGGLEACGPPGTTVGFDFVRSSLGKVRPG